MSKAKACCVGYIVFEHFDVEVDDDGELTDKGEEALHDGATLGRLVYLKVGDVVEEVLIETMREARNVAVQERDEARARLEEAQRIAAELRAELMQQRGKVSP